MAEVSSTRTLPLGAPAPDFALPDAAGHVHTLSGTRGPEGLIVAFLCNHCPYVIHLAASLGETAAEFAAQGVGFAGINSNDVERYPADSPSLMERMAKTSGWAFPYLYDASQSVAHAYAAACTPDFYLFGADLKLQYAGQYDGARPGNRIPVTGGDLRQAVQAMLSGALPLAAQHPSTGCSIKWKPGNEPPYFA